MPIVDDTLIDLTLGSIHLEFASCGLFLPKSLSCLEFFKVPCWRLDCGAHPRPSAQAATGRPVFAAHL